MCKWVVDAASMPFRWCYRCCRWPVRRIWHCAGVGYAAIAARPLLNRRKADPPAGAPAARDGASDLLAPLGQRVIVGMPGDDVTIDVAPSWLAAANKSILGSKMGGARVSVDVPALLDHHRAGRLDLGGMVSTTHPLDELEEAFGEVRRGEVLRTVILPNGSGDRDPADAPGVLV